MNRAYSILEIKAVSEDERIIEGIATTPTPDRYNDIVDPMGAKFKLPLALLWQHKSDQPVGFVEFAKPTEEGIPFKARIVKIPEPGELQNLVDKAWQAVKAGLVRAVSIGFTINAYEFLEGGGWRITEWEWLELSLVTIPANADATIQTIRSVDTELLAASGHKQPAGRTLAAGVTAPRKPPVVRAQEAKTMPKTIAEQIGSFEATRQAKSARMDEIMDGAAEKGLTLDGAEQEEYDGLAAELKSLDGHLVRLREREKTAAATAKAAKGETEDEGNRSRVVEGHGVKMAPNLPKGIAFTRLFIARYVASREFVSPIEVAKARWPDMPELQVALKTAVTVGSSSTLSALTDPQVMASEFIEYLFHKTIIGRIPGLRRVPFNIKIQRQTSVASVNWVGEGKPKPLGIGALDTVTLGFYKIAGIVPLTDEVVRFSNPSAETLVRDELAGAIVQLMDHDFLDPEKAAVTGVSPASLTNGVTAVSATGTAYANVAADVGSALANFDAARIDTSDLVVVMNTRQARALSLMLNSLGQRLFPDLALSGDNGRMLGYPVIISGNVDYTEDSPQEGDNIIFLKPSEIFLADDGQVSIDISREASVQMNTAPDDPVSASTVMVSAFQQNLVLVRAERYINWLKRRDAAVQYIKAAKYA